MEQVREEKPDTRAYLSLYHEAPPSSHILDKVEDVYFTLFLNPPQLCVDRDEGSSPPYTCAAVDHHRPCIRRTALHHRPYKVKQWRGLIRYAMIGPDREVGLTYDSLCFVALHLQGESANRVRSEHE
jgi:hypothetical protein